MSRIPHPSGLRWRLELSGGREELRALARMFPRGSGLGVHVWEEEGQFYLHASEFEAMAETSAVYGRGELMVERLNGVGFLKFGVFRPVAAGSLRDQFGGLTLFPGTGVIYVASNSLLSYLGDPALPPWIRGTTPPDSTWPAVERWTNGAADAVPEVDEALRLLTLASSSLRTSCWCSLI